MDAPKTLANEAERAARSAMLSLPHVHGLAQFVQRMREAKGPDHAIPDFDPLDGGADARLLYLLEAPGRRAVASGFISRNNPDETARNFFLLNAEAQIDRQLAVIWNAVPWYIGTQTKIRAARRVDVREADAWLVELLALLTRLRVVVFVGQKALHAQGVVRRTRPDVAIIRTPHPSPLFINRAPGNRDRLLSLMRELSARLRDDTAAAAQRT